MIISGKNSVLERIKSGEKILSIYILKNHKNYNDVLNYCNKNKINLKISDKFELSKLSSSSNNQGIVAKIPDFEYSDFDKLLEISVKKDKSIILLLDGIQDPHNLGSIIRVADCLGISFIVIAKNRSCKINDTIMRSSAGAINHIKIAMVTNLNYTIDKLKDNFYQVVSASMNGSDISDFNFSNHTAIVIGSEGDGISSLTLKKSDAIVSIPQYGVVNSLNASVATGIICHQVKVSQNI